MLALWEKLREIRRCLGEALRNRLSNIFAWPRTALRDCCFAESFFSATDSGCLPLIAEVVDYPLHLGITEAGSEFSGTVYSAVGIGALLWTGWEIQYAFP